MNEWQAVTIKRRKKKSRKHRARGRHALHTRALARADREAPENERFVREHWETTRGWYLLVREAGPPDYDQKLTLHARTRSASTAEKLRKIGFKDTGRAWQLYKPTMAGFTTY